MWTSASFVRLPASIAGREPLWRRLVIAVAIVVLLACAVRSSVKSADGDFKLHHEFGRRFLAGEFLYSGGLHVPYPPFWAMAHAPAAWLPLPVAKIALLPMGIAGLSVLIWTLRRLGLPAFPLGDPQQFWAMALALLLASRFIVRDLAELAVNTLLVALTWAAIYLWTQRREGLAGLSLGLAIALKCTPAIFVAYFVWKRQWRMAVISTAVAALLTLAPIIWQGPASYALHMKTWTSNALRGFASADPSEGVLGPEPLQNMALRPALARYLTQLPPGHAGRSSHPLYVDVLDLSPAAAGFIIKLILAALVGTVLWICRAPITRRDDPRLLWDLAAIGILMLLLSPITWAQHCVALLPACYFISAALVSDRQLPRWMALLLGLYALLVLLLARDLIGKNAALLLNSYHVQTFAIVGLLAVVLGCRRVWRLIPRLEDPRC